jgi:protein phosphatase
MVSDDENDQSVTPRAFALLNEIVGHRLALGKLTVVDATSVQPEARAPLVAIAKTHFVMPVAIVLDLPESVCHERNAGRPDRHFGPHVVRNQRSQLRRSMQGLKREGFRQIVVLGRPEEVDALTIERVPLWVNRKHETGPFDIIGDVHGCADELESLLTSLGYRIIIPFAGDMAFRCGPTYAHPDGRKAVFVGDLVDRGPRVVDTLRIVAAMMAHGSGLCVMGNHDAKLLKKLRGKDVTVAHGLAQTLAEIDAVDATHPKFVAECAEFLDGLISHFVLDGGRLVVAHAGIKEAMHGRASGAVRDFCLYGETTGETDEFGLPVRLDWAANYRGRAAVVYGHTPVAKPEWLNNTVNIDTGCVFGGALTALRWPERAFVSVPAARVYCEPRRPFIVNAEPPTALQHDHDDVLDLTDVTGKRIVSTRLRGNVTIREEHATAALEAMSRFAVDPKWMIYLPPTMSPCETSAEPGLLEHPAEAFAYFAKQGVPRVICEEKHMGSRAVVVVCRDADAARKRFGVSDGDAGIVYTRTGRRFFPDMATETALLDHLRAGITAAGLWDELNTDWLCLDAELLPWSAKAQALLKSQYSVVGAAGRAALPNVVAALKQTASHLTGEERAKLDAMTVRMQGRAVANDRFVAAYRHYCWPVNTLADLKLAPFHLLASEGAVHTDKPHAWHLETLAKIAAAIPDLAIATGHRFVDVADPGSVADGITWWTELTGRGGEGMVVKPVDFVHRSERGVVQPAVKCRGPEYLRIIYGPTYDEPDNLVRLRNRGLGAKRSLALGEFALGIEALERFVRREPLRRVHECVFGVLALESELVDPRL